MKSHELFVFLFFCLFSQPSLANTVYLDQAGLGGGSCSDSRDRSAASNETTPVCTLERANAIALNNDTIHIRKGTYTPPNRVNFYQDNLTIQSAPGESVVIDFADAATYNKGITLVGDGETLEGIEITNTWEECLVTYGSNLKILRNRIHHCGFELDEGSRYQGCIQSSASNVLFEGNQIYDCASHVMYMTGDGITIRNNIIFGAVAPPNPPTYPDGRQSVIIKIGTDASYATNVKIVHNVIGESKNRSGIYLTAPGGYIDTAIVANNLIYGNKGSYGWAIYVDNANTDFRNSIQIKNNAFAANEGGNKISFENDPPAGNFSVSGNLTFATLGEISVRDASAHDFYPKEGSPLVDSALADQASQDFIGTARPIGSAPDIGPYEFSTDISPPPALSGPTTSSDDGTFSDSTNSSGKKGCAVDGSMSPWVFLILLGFQGLMIRRKKYPFN